MGENQGRRVFSRGMKTIFGAKVKVCFPSERVPVQCPYSCMTDDCANERTDMCAQLTVYSIHEQLTPVGRC